METKKNIIIQNNKNNLIESDLIPPISGKSIYFSLLCCGGYTHLKIPYYSYIQKYGLNNLIFI